VTAIPREAALGFERGAAEYERGRPGYPEAAIMRLADELDIGPERTRLLDAVSELAADRGVVGAGGTLETPYRTPIAGCHRLQV
jgi:hypothetical protein